jgi:hypothetical protein
VVVNRGGHTGISVSDKEQGGQETERVRVMDWERPAKNDFLLASRLSVTGALNTCPRSALLEGRTLLNYY